MNETTGTRPPYSTGPESYWDTVRGIWASRPYRPRQGRKLAGVAAGVGMRYGVDPIVVRVAFIVTTVLGGAGVTAYLLGWLLLPSERAVASPVARLFGRRRSNSSVPATILLCLAMIPVMGWYVSAGFFDSGGVLGLALLATALYLLHRNRGQYHPHGSATAAPGDAGESAAFTHADLPADENRSPHAWDPLGAAPMGWDMPEPDQPHTTASLWSAQQEAPRRRRGNTRATLVTFALALVALGVGTALSATGVAGWFTAPHVIGMTLAILAVGLVMSAFSGGARPLIVAALPLAVAGIVLTVSPMSGFHGIGTYFRNPETAAQIQPDYRRTVGEVWLDLTELRGDEPVTVNVDVGVGEVTVRVPHDADVTYRCSSRIGNVSCLQQTRSGTNTAISGSREGPGKQQINIEASTGIGSVKVIRV